MNFADDNAMYQTFKCNNYWADLEARYKRTF